MEGCGGNRTIFVRGGLTGGCDKTMEDRQRASATQGEPLTCYQCNVERNDQCTDEYLLPCEGDQAFDRCMTTISYSKQHGYGIRKSCALAPCNLRDRSASSGLGLESCDRSQSEYTCIDCCRGDGCNKDAAPAAPSAGGAVVVLLAAAALTIWH